MTSASSALSLSATPRSVAEARHWVVEMCRSIDREDLVECAELAVSELVTNAILHGSPPLAVRLGGTTSHPRFEVTDGSRKAPEPPPKHYEDDLLTTVGRGLRLVAMCSSAWGARIGVEGKAVWFVPLSEPGHGEDPDPPQIEYEEGPAAAAGDLVDPVDIQILGLPVGPYRELRRHVSELRRELRLLALASEADYPLAGQLSDLFQLFEREFASSIATELKTGGANAVDGPLDLDLVVDREAIATVAQLMDVLEMADAFSHAERLLSVAASPEQKVFNRWYLGEFVRQGRGHPPTRWSGGADPEPAEASASGSAPAPANAPAPAPHEPH